MGVGVWRAGRWVLGCGELEGVVSVGMRKAKVGCLRDIHRDIWRVWIRVF